MHRKYYVPGAWLGGLLVLGLLLGQGAAVARAQAEPPPIAGSVIAEPLAIGSTKRLQMSKKQTIKEVQNEKDTVVRVSQVPGDPRTILVSGLTPGVSRLTFTGVDGTVEVIDVIVALDIELLNNLLRRAVPTAVVTPMAGAGNTIILTGTVSHAEDVDVIIGIARSITAGGTTPPQIINAMRVGGVMQVQLDVVVARVNRRETRLMSVDILDFGVNHFLKHSIGVVDIPGGPLSGTFPGAIDITNQIARPNGQIANTTFGIFNDRQAVFVWLQALRTNNLAKLLAEPHIVTLSGRSANFVSGGEQAVPQVSGFGGTAGVQFVPFGTSVNFLPIVLGNGKIYLEVEPEVSALDNASGVVIPGGGLVPGRNTQRIRTSVTIETGQTLAIGGLTQRVVQANTIKTPVVGDIPFLGALFSTKSYDEVEEELVILVTPYLVDPLDCKQVPNYLPGQETRSPDDFELFLEGILEAPRGPRNVCPGGRYQAPHKNSPTVNVFPCSGADGNGGTYGGCRAGCGAPVANPAAATTAVYESSLPLREDVLPAGGEPARVRPVDMELPSPLPDEYR